LLQGRLSGLVLSDLSLSEIWIEPREPGLALPLVKPKQETLAKIQCAKLPWCVLGHLPKAQEAARPCLLSRSHYVYLETRSSALHFDEGFRLRVPTHFLALGMSCKTFDKSEARRLTQTNDKKGFRSQHVWA